MERNVGLFLGVPTLGRPIPIQWAFALAALRAPINYNVHSAVVWGQEVAEARNNLARAALDSGARYLMFIGDDTVLPGHGLKQLIYRMEHNPHIGVVGGIYVSKDRPPAPLVFRGNGSGSYWNWKVGEFFEVSGIGMDATLIRTDVFRDLPEPWFRTIDEDSYLDGEPKVEKWTEDLYFCTRIMDETSWRIYADSMVMCEHWEYLGGNRWDRHTMRKDSKPMQRIEMNGQKRILDIGCGEVHWDFGNEGIVIRVDRREECRPDYRCDVRQLPFGNDEFDIVFSSHVLEHFDRGEVSEVLKEWVRVLRKDGELRLIVPSIEWAADRIREGRIDDDVLNVLYGAQTYDLNFHRCGFTSKTLSELIRTLSLEPEQCIQDGYNIFLQAKK